MPHDMNGKLLAVGDLVLVPCRVTAVYLTEDFCNVTLETRQPMYPSQEPSTLTFNARQVRGEVRLSHAYVDLSLCSCTVLTGGARSTCATCPIHGSAAAGQE